MVQEILRTAPSPIAREFLLHYYISAKSWPLVLLIGRPGVGKRRLFQLLAAGIAGGTDGRIRLLPAQFPGREQVGPGSAAEDRSHLDSIQGRFNTMAFLDLLAEAGMPGNEGQVYFLCLDQATPQELGEYMDLYLTGTAGAEGPPPLSPNLYLTAVLSTIGGAWSLPPALLNRIGIVEVTVSLGEEEEGAAAPHCPPVGWQRLFLRSTVRDPERARRRLSGFGLLREFQHLQAALQGSLGPEMGPDLEEGLLLYVANSFTAAGEGLLENRGAANLRQAVDLQAAQRLLPCMAQQSSWTEDRWVGLLGQLEGIFPRAHARARRILLEKFSTAGTAKEAAADLLPPSSATSDSAFIGSSALSAPSDSTIERGNR